MDSSAAAARGPGSALVTMALAALVGALSGCAAWLFRWLITTVTDLVTGHPETLLSRDAVRLGPWWLVLAPVVAGALYGPLVAHLSPEVRGSGVGAALEAADNLAGVIRPRVAVLKALASALCLGGGGSLGREGPIIHIGAALGSATARVCRLDAPRVRLLLACGAAGGIAGTFGTPVAGALFAIEVVLRELSARVLLVLVSALTASAVATSIHPLPAFVRVPGGGSLTAADYLGSVGLGLLAGIASVALVRFLWWLHAVADQVWRGPEALRPAVGGVLVGLLLLALPQLYGVGTPVIDAAAAGRYAVGLLALLAVAKILAASLTLAIGGSGGVIGPCLFVGALLGAAYAEVLPGSASGMGVAAYAVTGMAAVLGAAGHAPLTATATGVELCGVLSLLGPTLLTVALAVAVVLLTRTGTVFTQAPRPAAPRSGRGPARPDRGHRPTT